MGNLQGEFMTSERGSRSVPPLHTGQALGECHLLPPHLPPHAPLALNCRGERLAVQVLALPRTVLKGHKRDPNFMVFCKNLSILL